MTNSAGCRIVVLRGSGRSRGGWTSRVTGGKEAVSGVKMVIFGLIFTGPHILYVMKNNSRLGSCSFVLGMCKCPYGHWKIKQTQILLILFGPTSMNIVGSN